MDRRTTTSRLLTTRLLIMLMRAYLLDRLNTIRLLTTRLLILEIGVSKDHLLQRDHHRRHSRHINRPVSQPRSINCL